MFWPTVVSHKIDDESPLWEFSARNIARFKQTINIFIDKLSVFEGAQCFKLGVFWTKVQKDWAEINKKLIWSEIHVEVIRWIAIWPHQNFYTVLKSLSQLNGRDF